MEGEEIWLLPGKIAYHAPVQKPLPVLSLNKGRRKACPCYGQMPPPKGPICLFSYGSYAVAFEHLESHVIEGASWEGGETPGDQLAAAGTCTPTAYRLLPTA